MVIDTVDLDHVICIHVRKCQSTHVSFALRVVKHSRSSKSHVTGSSICGSHDTMLDRKTSQPKLQEMTCTGQRTIETLEDAGVTG